MYLEFICEKKKGAKLIDQIYKEGGKEGRGGERASKEKKIFFFPSSFIHLVKNFQFLLGERKKNSCEGGRWKREGEEGENGGKVMVI